MVRRIFSFVLCRAFLDDDFAMDPIGDSHFNGSQDNGPLSGDHWENELMGAKTTSGMCVCFCVRACVCVCARTHMFYLVLSV